MATRAKNIDTFKTFKSPARHHARHASKARRAGREPLRRGRRVPARQRLPTMQEGLLSVVGNAHPTFSLQSSPPFLKVYGPGTWVTNVSETWVTGWKCSSDCLKIPLNPPLKKGDFEGRLPFGRVTLGGGVLFEKGDFLILFLASHYSSHDGHH